MNRGAYIAFMLLVGILGSFQVLPNDMLAIIVFIVVFQNFYKALDTHIPILEITACIAALQWLLGPVISYAFGALYERYDMYVEASRYFSFALPATCSYLAALRVLPEDTQQHEYFQNVRQDIFFNRGITLVIISFCAQLINRSGSAGGLAFFFSLLTQLRYVGALYFLFSAHRYRYLFIAVALCTLLIQTAESAMFHDLIIWMSLLACYWYQTVKWNTTKKAILFISGFCFVFTIQLIKADYRAKVWQGQEASLLASVHEKIILNQEFFNADSLRAAGMRINQGWIISAVMLNVPLVEPYAKGETIKDAAISAIFPRVIMKDKAMAGGQVNFERFTGLQLGGATSMGISILGEAYANFGTFGGSIFMFIWGLGFASVYQLATRFAKSYPTFLFWLPLIFYQAIKAETELLVVLNQLIKGSIVAFAAYYGLYLLIPTPKNRDSDENLEESEGEDPEENYSNRRESPNL